MIRAETMRAKPTFVPSRYCWRYLVPLFTPTTAVSSLKPSGPAEPTQYTIRQGIQRPSLPNLEPLPRRVLLLLVTVLVMPDLLLVLEQLRVEHEQREVIEHSHTAVSQDLRS